MPSHETGTGKSGLPPGWNCSRPSRRTPGAATSWLSTAGSCPGSASTSSAAFDTDDGPASLAGLFHGNSQLLLYHFMFGPDYTAGCPTWVSAANGY